jgi:NMD protein affecting ribosome stability and mRNA decay
MICPRCGREQPSLHSPCPQCGRLGSTSSIPTVQTLNTGTEAETDPRRRGGEVEPSHLIRDPELRAAFMRAYRAYLRRRMREAKT